MRRSGCGVWLSCAAVCAAGVLSVIGVRNASAAPYLLTNAPGDGSVSVQVDGYGSFGSSIGADADDALYDPVGPGTTAGTAYESGVAIRFGNSGTRQFLTSGTIGSSGALANPGVTG